MSPGSRLIVAPSVLLGAALLAYVVPERRHRLGHLLAAAAIIAAAVLLATTAPLAFPAGSVERSLGDLAPGAPLTLRADATGLVIALLSLAAAMVALLETDRGAVEWSALLLCAAGGCICGLAGNAVLLFAGLELGNLGALLLLASSAPAGSVRGWWSFAVQHAAALGLLAAAVELTTGVGTSDLSAIPASSLTAAVAFPWALAGAVRLAAAVGLPEYGGRVPATAWASVAAAPSGLAVLLRLDQVAGGSLPTALSVLLTTAGCALAVIGALVALGRRLDAPAAGRALCVAAAGPVVALLGVDTPATLVAGAAAGVALVLAMACAPGWSTATGGDAGRRLRAACLASAGGLPIGVGTATVLLGAGTAVGEGLPRSLVGLSLAAAGLCAAAAAALAARAALAAPVADAPSRLRLDAAVALGVSLLFGIVPGLMVSIVAVRLVGSDGGISAVQSAAFSGPGGGWAGGYLVLAVAVAAVAAVSAGSLQGLAPPRRERTAVPVPVRGVAARLPRRRLEVVLDSAGRGLTTADHWLFAQPGLALVALAAVAAFLVLR